MELPSLNLPGAKMDISRVNQCLSLLQKLMDHQYGWIFNTPVDPVKLCIPDYFFIIKNPMDLGTVKENLHKRKYTCAVQFAEDVRLTFSNAMLYNPPMNEVHIVAKQLSNAFEARWTLLEDKWNKTRRGDPNPRLGLAEPAPTMKKVKPSGSAEENGSTYKKARVEVNGVPDGNGSANATNTNTSASTCVEGEVTEQDREKEKERAQVKPSELLKEKDTAFKPSGSAEENVVTYKMVIVEVNGVPDGNGMANTNSNNSANTRVEGEVKEQDRDKEKEREQMQPSGLLEEKDTAFEPSGSVKDKGSTSRTDNVETWMVRCESSQLNADAEYLYEHPDAEYLDTEYLYEHLDAEFHNFNICRTCNNFQEGNIWALYSDLDTFPKYYGLICKVEYEPFQVHINWLKACPKSDVERAWLGANLPISCGKFRVTTQNMTYDKPDYFSHMVRYHDRGNYYEILPEVGEVWAIYKNWSAGWMPCDFKTSKFDIVEVIENREQSTIVCPLRQVPEYTSVFMLDEVDGADSGAWEVPASAYILFSHKIPAIRLKDECGGKLEGFWELDLASVP